MVLNDQFCLQWDVWGLVAECVISLPSHIVAISKWQDSAQVTVRVGTKEAWRFMVRSEEGSSAADAVSETLYKPSGYMLGGTGEMNGVSHGALKHWSHACLR